MLQSEETTETESLSEFTILASNEESQHLLGQRMEQGIPDELAKEALEVEVIEREVRMQTQGRRRKQKNGERRERAVISYSDEDYSVLQKNCAGGRRVCATTGKDTGCKCNHQPGENKKFPNSVKAVVYEPSQFSPVLDGTINSCKG